MSHADYLGIAEMIHSHIVNRTRKQERKLARLEAKPKTKRNLNEIRNQIKEVDNVKKVRAMTSFYLNRKLPNLCLEDQLILVEGNYI